MPRARRHLEPRHLVATEIPVRVLAAFRAFAAELARPFSHAVTAAMEQALRDPDFPAAMLLVEARHELRAAIRRCRHGCGVDLDAIASHGLDAPGVVQASTRPAERCPECMSALRLLELASPGEPRPAGEGCCCSACLAEDREGVGVEVPGLDVPDVGPMAEVPDGP